MSILTNRLRYILSPQFDIYEQVARVVKGSVADVGCGLGFGSHLLFQNATKVDGYDANEDYLKFAARAFPNIKFFKSDITEKKLPYYYNFIVTIDVIEHIKDINKAIKNIYDSLGNDGIFICSTPNRKSRYRKSENHIVEYSPKELKQLLEQFFDVVDIKSFGFKPLKTYYENPLLGIGIKRGKNG